MDVSKIMMADVCEEWLNMKRLLIKQSTYAKYRNIVERHIEPDIGAYNLGNLNSYLINSFIYEKMKKGRLDREGELAVKTVRDITTILKSIVKYAEKEYHTENLAGNSVLPKRSRAKFEVLSLKEQKVMEEYLLDNLQEPRCAGLLICLYTGLRIGEICALKWNNIDFESKSITITHTLQRISMPDLETKRKTRIIIDEPKSESSFRAIPIPEKIFNIIRKSSYPYNDEDFFLTNSSKYVEPRNYQYFFRRTLKIMGIREVNFHILRHTFATRCVEVGFDVKTLSEILGHADTSITLNYYIHSSWENKQRQMMLLEG